MGTIDNIEVIDEYLSIEEAGATIQLKLHHPFVYMCK